MWIENPNNSHSDGVHSLKGNSLDQKFKIGHLILELTKTDKSAQAPTISELTPTNFISDFKVIKISLATLLEKL